LIITGDISLEIAYRWIQTIYCQGVGSNNYYWCPPPPLKLLGRPASIARPAASIQLNLLFTFTHLFVSHAQPNGDRQRTDKRMIGPTRKIGEQGRKRKELWNRWVYNFLRTRKIERSQIASIMHVKKWHDQHRDIYSVHQIHLWRFAR